MLEKNFDISSITKLPEHLDTPRKARIRGAKALADNLATEGVKIPLSKIATSLGESKTTVIRTIRSESDRRRFEQRDVYEKEKRYETPNEKNQKTIDARRKRAAKELVPTESSSPKRRRIGDANSSKTTTRGPDPRGRRSTRLVTPELDRIEATVEENGPDGHNLDNEILRCEAELPDVMETQRLDENT